MHAHNQKGSTRPHPDRLHEIEHFADTSGSYGTKDTLDRRFPRTGGYGTKEARDARPIPQRRGADD